MEGIGPDPAPPPPRIRVGFAGEDAALAWYRRRGFVLLARNWRCALGELDLVLRMGRTVVFCEVKTRRGGAFGGPFEAVTWKKQQKLRRLAEAFLAVSPLRPNGVRFDVASVVLDGRGRGHVHVFDQAF